MISRLLVSATLLLAACSASDGAIEKVEEARARNDGPAIWAVRDDDSTLYLYGTIHLIPDGLDWQRDDMAEAFSRAGTVWFEVPTTEAARAKTERLTRQRGFLPLGERLSADWDQYTTKTLEIAALQADLPLEVLDTMEPWLAADIVTVATADKGGLSADTSPDEALKSRAERAGKYVRYLDTVEDQIALSADVPEAAQLENLYDVLERYNRISLELESIATEWVEGDADGLEERLARSVTGDNRERLFTARNAKWADELAEWMEGSGTGFAAVGVGHLVGEGSLVEQLRERDLRVERFYDFQGENVIRPVELGSVRGVGD